MKSRRSLFLGATAILLTGAALFASPDGTAGGVSWTVPSGWTAQAPRSMRVATYAIPGAAGAEAGECGVYYFGKGQGGTVDENVARWAQQFSGAPKPVRSDSTVAGLRVHRVTLAGTYLAPGGPMMQSQGAKPNSRLLGAIVEAPGGLVFFKCTGPAATIAAAEKAFNALIASLTKAATTV